jgi:hypothetical protein
MSVMGRRDFLGMLGTAAAWPSLAFGQQQRVPVVGFVGFAAIEIDSATLVPRAGRWPTLAMSRGAASSSGAPADLRHLPPRPEEDEGKEPRER